MTKKRPDRSDDEGSEASESGDGLSRWAKGKRRTVAAKSAARTWRQGKHAHTPSPLADQPSEMDVASRAEVSMKRRAEASAGPESIDQLSPEVPGETREERPEWGREEMSLFFGVLGLSISQLAVFQAWPFSFRALAALGTTVVALPLISKVAPRLNSLVAFLTRPHSFREYGTVFGRAWKWQHRERNWKLKRVLTVVVALAIVVAWVVVFPRQIAEANKARDEAARERSASIAAQSKDLIDSEPDLALLLAIEARRVYPTEAARGSLMSSLERRRNLKLNLRHPSNALAVAASADGTFVASGHATGSIVIWDAASGESREIANAHEGPVRALAFSQNGLLASAGIDQIIRVWDPETLRPVTGTGLTHHDEAIWDLSFTADSSRLVSVGDDGLRVWDLSRGQVFRRNTGRTLAATLDASSSRVVIGRVGSAEVWDLRTQERIGGILRLSGQVRSVAFRPGSDRIIIAAGEDGRLVRWDVATGEEIEIGRHDGLQSLIVDEPNRRMATAGGGTVKLWDASGRQITFDREIPIEASLLAFVGSDDLAVVGQLVINIVTLLEQQPLAAPLVADGRAAWALAVDANRARAASGHAQGEVFLWDLETGEANSFDTSTAHGSITVAAIALSPNGTQMATGDIEGNLALWDIDQAAPIMLFALEATRSSVRDLAFDVSGDRLISGHANGTIRIWDSGDRGLVLHGIFQDQAGVWAVAYNPERDEVASAGNDGVVTLRDGSTGEELARSTYSQDGRVRDLVFSPDGKILLSGGDEGVLIRWDAKTLDRVDTKSLGSQVKVWAIAYSVDGRAIAVAEGDNLTILDEQLRRIGDPLSGHLSNIQGLGFMPGFGVITASSDGSIRHWDLGFDTLTNRACVIANRNLSQAEWNQLTSDENYVRHCKDLPSGEGAPQEAPPAVFMTGAEEGP